MIRLDLDKLQLYAQSVIRPSAPYVRVGRGMDISRSGVVRGLLTYGVTRLEELAAAGQTEPTVRALCAGTWWCSELPWRQLRIPLDLWNKVSRRPEIPHETAATTISMITELGLKLIRTEVPAEVADFWLAHFNAEAAAGLRRGRKSRKKPYTSTPPAPPSPPSV